MTDNTITELFLKEDATNDKQLLNINNQGENCNENKLFPQSAENGGTNRKLPGQTETLTSQNVAGDDNTTETIGAISLDSVSRDEPTGDSDSEVKTKQNAEIQEHEYVVVDKQQCTD